MGAHSHSEAFALPAARNYNLGPASILRCDHCRGKLSRGVHRYWQMQFCCSACMTAYQQRLAPETIAKITAGSGGSPVSQISGKKTSGGVPGLLGITQRVSIAVVVALTGDHFRLVMLAFFSVRFCSGNDRRDIFFSWRCFFRDR